MSLITKKHGLSLSIENGSTQSFVKPPEKSNELGLKFVQEALTPSTIIHETPPLTASGTSPEVTETPQSMHSESSPVALPQSTTPKKRSKRLSLFGQSEAQGYKPRSNLKEIRERVFRHASADPIQELSEMTMAPIEVIVVPPTQTCPEIVEEFQKDDDLPTWAESPTKINSKVFFQTAEDREFLKKLSIKGIADFNAMVGVDFSKLEAEALMGSELGSFLQENHYEIEELLKTDGANSYCFTVRKEGSSNVQFLKVLKPKNWDAPSLKNCLYSEERGAGWLMKNKDKLLHTLVPDEVVSVDKNGKITSKCQEGDLILATISPLVNATNLKSLMENGKLKEDDIPQLITKILEAVNAFKQNRMTHRDLTPQNILIKPDTLEVSIIDFDHGVTGVCRPLDGCYAAPESSSKIDEFTLGLVFLEMCTGIKPSDPSSKMEGRTHRDEILAGEIPLSTAPGKLSLITPIIQGFLETDPDQRWDTIYALEVLRKTSNLIVHTKQVERLFVQEQPCALKV